MRNEDNPKKTREQALSESLEHYKRVSTAHTYMYEICTVDIVLGFRKTLRKRTRSLTKSIAIRAKLLNDLGSFISPTVRIVSVFYYVDGKQEKYWLAKPLQ